MLSLGDELQDKLVDLDDLVNCEQSGEEVYGLGTSASYRWWQATLYRLRDRCVIDTADGIAVSCIPLLALRMLGLRMPMRHNTTASLSKREDMPPWRNAR